VSRRLRPITADDRLAQICVKIERAKKHLIDFEVELRAFLDSEPYKTGTKPDPKIPKAIKYYVVSAADPPLALAAIAGDVIHNLRSALDHLVWHLIAVSKKPGDTVGFPIFNNSSGYKSGRYGKVKGMSKLAIKAIDRYKPYKRGNDALWRLHRLDIIDKHRHLVTAGVHVTSFIPQPLLRVGLLKALAAQKGWPVNASDAQIETIAISMPLSRRACPLKVGNVLRLPFDHIPDIPELKENIHFTFDVAFNEAGVIKGESILETLHVMADRVENLILNFKPLLV
jgi:hypothetical protein